MVLEQEQNPVEPVTVQAVAATIAASSVTAVAIWLLTALGSAALQAAARGEYTGNADWAIVTLTWVGLPIAALIMGLVKRYLKNLESDIPAFISIVAVGALIWVLLVPGDLTSAPDFLSLESSILVLGGVTVLLSVGHLIVDVSAVAKRIWFTLQAICIGVLTAATLFLLLVPLVSFLLGFVVLPPVFVAVIAALAAGFAGVRVSRNTLFGVEDAFLTENALPTVVCVVAAFAGTFGYASFLNGGFDPASLLLYSCVGLLVWYVLAFVRQRPSGA